MGPPSSAQSSAEDLSRTSSFQLFTGAFSAGSLAPLHVTLGYCCYRLGHDLNEVEVFQALAVHSDTQMMCGEMNLLPLVGMRLEGKGVSGRLPSACFSCFSASVRRWSGTCSHSSLIESPKV